MNEDLELHVIWDGTEAAPMGRSLSEIRQPQATRATPFAPLYHPRRTPKAEAELRNRTVWEALTEDWQSLRDLSIVTTLPRESVRRGLRALNNDGMIATKATASVRYRGKAEIRYRRRHGKYA